MMFGIGSAERIDAICLVEIEQSFDSFHAYAVPQGVAIRPGDEVLIHDAPTRIDYGERLSRECRITVTRAGAIKRSWTRMISLFRLTELYEVGFESGERR